MFTLIITVISYGTTCGLTCGETPFHTEVQAIPYETLVLCELAAEAYKQTYSARYVEVHTVCTQSKENML